MISRAGKILIIVLVGGFPLLCSMGMTPCCGHETSTVKTSCCCQNQELETPVGGSSFPLDHQDTCLCSLEFYAIQSSSVSLDTPAVGSSFDLSQWDHRDTGQQQVHGPHASGFCLSGRAMRVQLSSLLC